MRIKLLIDWFEVLTNGIYGAGEMGRLVETIGLSKEEYMLKDNGRCWELLQKNNRGLISERKYWKEVIAETNWEVTAEQMMALTDRAVATPIPGTLDVLRDLHAMGYELILVSDLGHELKERILTYYPWINQLYRQKYFSCDYGKIKSDPGYFEFIMKSEGIEPGKAVFIDDYHINVARAAEAGITGVLFKDAIQLKETLTEMGIYKPIGIRVS